MDQQAAVSTIRAVSRHRPPHGAAGPMTGDHPCARSPFLPLPPQSSAALPPPRPELQAKVEALGYKVQKAKLKTACGELYTIDKNGGRVELFVDPTSGQIIGQL